MCGLVKKYEPANGTIFLDEPFSQSQIGHQVITNPVFTASHAIERRSTERGFGNDGELGYIQTNGILRMFEAQLPCPSCHVLADDADLCIQPFFESVRVKLLFEVFDLWL
ncbi:hypothetical protein D3C84_660140 [compost metagenome]